MSDTVMQNEIINSVIHELGGKVDNEPKKVPLIKTKKKTICKVPLFKRNTLSAIKKDKEIQELIKPKFRVISNVNLSKTANNSFANKGAIHCSKLQPDNKGNIFIQQPTFETALKDVTQESFTTMLPNENNGNDQTQNENLDFPKINPPLGIVKNCILSPTEYVIVRKDSIGDVNINRPRSETEIKPSQQAIVVKNNTFPLQNNITNANLNIVMNSDSWELIKNTNILRNTKYIVVKKNPNAFVNTNESTNGNVMENQIDSLKQGLAIENIPKDDSGAQMNTVYTNETTKPKPRKYVRKPKNPNLKNNNSQTQKNMKMKRGKNSVPNFSNRNNLEIHQIANNIPNEQIQHSSNIFPILPSTVTIKKISPATATLKKTENSESKSIPENFQIIEISESTNVSTNFQRTENSESTSVTASFQTAKNLKTISIPTSSQIPELINSEGKAFLLIPFKKLSTVQGNSPQPETDTNIFTMVPLESIQILKEGNATEIHMKPSPSSAIEGIVRGTVSSNIGVKLLASNITQKKKRVVIRKRSANAKNLDVTKKNDSPIIIRKSNKYGTLIKKYSREKKDTETPSEDAPVTNNTTSSANAYSEIMNRFPLILPKAVSDNSGKQSDILERAIASINMEEFVPDEIMLDEDVNNFNGQPIYTQSLDRNVLSSEQRASMFYLRNDPMLPQYSTRKL